MGKKTSLSDVRETTSHIVKSNELLLTKSSQDFGKQK